MHSSQPRGESSHLHDGLRVNNYGIVLGIQFPERECSDKGHIYPDPPTTPPSLAWPDPIPHRGKGSGPWP